MERHRRRAWQPFTSRVVGYAVAVTLPVLVTFGVAWLGLPAFVFEHIIVLLVLGVAIPFGVAPAVVAAVVSVLADNVLLRPPIGQPTIHGWRDVFDLVLFAAVAVVVSGLVRRAHTARVLAEEAVARERVAREERDRLISTVAHDLATPLAILNGTTQFVRRAGLTGETDLQRLFARLETASARTTALVKTLADARALESHEVGLAVTLLDLHALVAPIVDMMDRFSDRHPMMLAAPDHPVFVRGDADRLQRVVENLLSNAIKYSPDGGTVEVSVSAEHGSAVLRVRDHGIGISAEALPHIFERSYRAPEAAARAPGLGLGLSIAAQVVRRHGGTLHAAAAEGEGTIVSVRLPLAPDGDVQRESTAAGDAIGR